MQHKLKVHLVLAFVSLLFGANYTVAKIVMPQYIHPLGMIAFRVPAATLLFWLFHSLVAKHIKPSRVDILRFFASAFFGVAVNQIFFFKGISLTSPMMGSVLMTSTPIFVLVVSYFLLNERITWLKLVGILLGAFGAILLIINTGTSFGNSTFLGNVFILINAISYSIYLVIVKPLMHKYDALTVIKWVFLFGSIMVIPFGIHDLLGANWNQFTPKIWVAVGYIIIGSTFLAYLLNVWSLKSVNSSLVGYYIYLQPIFATLIAVMVRGDTIKALELLYAAMIFSGVFLVSYSSQKANP